MLFKILIDNFKPFGTPQKARLAPLTLIYGPNSGGKSSIVQSLMLLRQSIGDKFNPAHPIVANGEWVDVGSFRSLIHRHDMARSLKLELSYRPSTLASPDIDDQSEHPFDAAYMRNIALTFRAISDSSAEPRIDRLGYRLSYDAGSPKEPQRLAIELSRSQATEYLAKLYPLGQIEHSVYEWADDVSARSYAQFLLMRGELGGNRALTWERQQLRDMLERISGKTQIRRGLFLDSVKEYLVGCAVVGRNGFPSSIAPKLPPPNPVARLESSVVHLAPGLNAIAEEYRSILRGIEYLGPLRRYPERYYMLHGAPDSVGKEGENTPQLLSQSDSSDQIVMALNEWFKIFHIAYTVAVSRLGDEVLGEIMAILLEDQRTKTPVAPTDVGFGLGQMLPILVQGISSGGKTICVEQPEIHLHPRLQGTLGDFFLWSAGALHSDDFPLRVDRRSQVSQWIVETHSEALILRVLRRIREGLIKNDDVSVIYVSPQSGSGAEIIELQIDEKGHFVQTWPDGFFEEAFQEIFQ